MAVLEQQVGDGATLLAGGADDENGGHDRWLLDRGCGVGAHPLASTFVEVKR
ncbi:hypothetical protein F4553_006957 [Allocatelliglobosispora scoriae]|uniref:Uncharacterized protein n=1 Tax=Allocatelliglobosispora scoriae TaxID=643052 RepID=A0A841C314_9ACTN|nr:hypothetical protein [Allocatelliglobosispora scoriae]